MKHIFIINPKAGRSSAVHRLTDQIHECFRSYDHPYEIHVTQCGGDGARIARRFAKSGEQLRIFACGGDGSSSDIVNGIAGYENAAMGVIPCGTGNDFIKYFEHAEHFSCIEDQINGTVCKLDAIRAGERYCLNQASVGLDAQVCAHKDKFSRLPFVGGQAAYILSLFYCFFSAIRNRFTVQVDEEPSMQGDYLLAVAANGRYYGGGFQSAPNALANDGLLECMAVDSISRFRIMSLLKKYAKGEHLGLPVCHYTRGRSMTVAAEKEMAVNLDGEVIPAKQITFEIVPQFVRFILPRGCRMPGDAQRAAVKEPALSAQK